MALLLVTYDLRKPDHKDYPDFHKTIKSYDWQELSESSYAIVTDETPGAVYDKLRPYQHENDYIYIITLTSPWQGYGRKTVIQWLQEHI